MVRVSSGTSDRRRETPAQRSKFARVRGAQVEYERKLRRVARTVGAVVRGLGEGDPVGSASAIREALLRYSAVVSQWARRAAATMLSEVQRRDSDAWASLAKTMSRELNREIQSAPTGEVMRSLMEEQVALITSLPTEAAQRVHELALKSMETGARADEIATEIMRSGEVTASRAASIARTETARASSVLVQARSEHVGSIGYIWRTSRDGDVRPDHKRLEGQFILWSEPPIADLRSGTRAHAGCIWECRCWPEPVVPEFRAEAA